MAYVGRTPANAALTAADLENGIVSADKLATNAVTEVKVNADAITNAKTEFTPGLTIKGDGSSADGKIILNCSQNSHGVSIAGPAHSAGQSYNLVLPTSVGTNGQVLATNGNSTNQLSWIDAIETKPTVTSVSPSTIDNTATDVTITGTNFVSGATVELQSTTGAIITPSTVSFTNSTTMVINVTIADDIQMFVRVENPDGNAGRSSSAILTTSDAPVWTTAAGSLGTVAGDFSGTVATVAGTGDTIAFSETTNVLTNSSLANCSLNSSTGVITTTDFGGSSTTATTYNFTLRLTDAQSQTADRSFSLTSSFGATGGGQFN